MTDKYSSKISFDLILINEIIYDLPFTLYFVNIFCEQKMNWYKSKIIKGWNDELVYSVQFIFTKKSSSLPASWMRPSLRYKDTHTKSQPRQAGGSAYFSRSDNNYSEDVQHFTSWTNTLCRHKNVCEITHQTHERISTNHVTF